MPVPEDRPKMQTEPAEDNAGVAAAADAAIAAAARGLGRPQDPAKKHPSYFTPCKSFTKFVDEMRRKNKLPAGPMYTTRRNIDLFAADKLAAMVGHRTTGERMVAAGMNQLMPRVQTPSAAAQARMVDAQGFLDQLGLGQSRSTTNGGSGANVDV